MPIGDYKCPPPVRHEPGAQARHDVPQPGVADVADPQPANHHARRDIAVAVHRHPILPAVPAQAGRRLGCLAARPADLLHRSDPDPLDPQRLQIAASGIDHAQVDNARPETDAQADRLGDVGPGAGMAAALPGDRVMLGGVIAVIRRCHRYARSPEQRPPRRAHMREIGEHLDTQARRQRIINQSGALGMQGRFAPDKLHLLNADLGGIVNQLPPIRAGH